jgi:hypothetical protein
MILPSIIDVSAIEDSSRIVVIGGEVPRYDYKFFMDFITIDNKMCEDIISYNGTNNLQAYGNKKIISYMKTENIHNEEVT